MTETHIACRGYQCICWLCTILTWSSADLPFSKLRALSNNFDHLPITDMVIGPENHTLLLYRGPWRVLVLVCLQTRFVVNCRQPWQYLEQYKQCRDAVPLVAYLRGYNCYAASGTSRQPPAAKSTTERSCNTSRKQGSEEPGSAMT